MNTNNFINIGFNDNIESNYLNHLFESAWDTLSKLYPNCQLDASDCYTIYALSNNNISSNNDAEQYMVFNLGISNKLPALQNLETKEIILIKINNYSWY